MRSLPNSRFNLTLSALLSLTRLWHKVCKPCEQAIWLKFQLEEKGDLYMSNINRDGTLGEEASAMGDRVSGNVKDAVGSVTGNSSLEREGEMQAATGSARQGQNRVLTGMFRDRDSAERAYNSAMSRGYTKDDVNLLMSCLLYTSPSPRD